MRKMLFGVFFVVYSIMYSLNVFAVEHLISSSGDSVNIMDGEVISISEDVEDSDESGKKNKGGDFFNASLSSSMGEIAEKDCGDLEAFIRDGIKDDLDDQACLMFFERECSGNSLVREACCKIKKDKSSGLDICKEN